MFAYLVLVLAGQSVIAKFYNEEDILCKRINGICTQRKSSCKEGVVFRNTAGCSPGFKCCVRAYDPSFFDDARLTDDLSVLGKDKIQGTVDTGSIYSMHKMLREHELHKKENIFKGILCTRINGECTHRSSACHRGVVYRHPAGCTLGYKCCVREYEKSFFYNTGETEDILCTRMNGVCIQQNGACDEGAVFSNTAGCSQGNKCCVTYDQSFYDETDITEETSLLT